MNEGEAETRASMVRDRTAAAILKGASAETGAKIKFCEYGIGGCPVMCRGLQAESERCMEETARVEAEAGRIKGEGRRIKAGLSDTASAAGGVVERGEMERGEAASPSLPLRQSAFAPPGPA